MSIILNVIIFPLNLLNIAVFGHILTFCKKCYKICFFQKKRYYYERVVEPYRKDCLGRAVFFFKFIRKYVYILI